MNSKTHVFATKKAIELSNFKIETVDKEFLIAMCLKPDEDETDGAFKWHFYNPATRKNFRGERTSALTKFIEHYQEATKEKDSYSSLNHLGRAIHYLEDLCTPVHTYYEDMFDATYRLKQHIEFEALCDKITDQVDISNSKINDNYYLVNSLKTIGKSCAMKASVLFNKLDENPKAAEVIGKQTIENTIKAVQGILFRFFKGEC